MYTFLFSCAVASVDIFRTILNNGYNGDNNEHPDFNRSVSSYVVLSEMLVLYFLSQSGDAAGLTGQGPGCFQHCNVFNYYE